MLCGISFFLSLSLSLSYTYPYNHTRTHARSDACRTGLLPGVFVNYELSPLRVRIYERRRSLGHFLTNCCAIIGGVLTVAGLLDSLLYRLNQVSGSRKGELAR